MNRCLSHDRAGRMRSTTHDVVWHVIVWTKKDTEEWTVMVRVGTFKFINDGISKKRELVSVERDKLWVVCWKDGFQQSWREWWCRLIWLLCSSVSSLEQLCGGEVWGRWAGSWDTRGGRWVEEEGVVAVQKVANEGLMWECNGVEERTWVQSLLKP